jgi:L-amino acid N-acyltransferase YncA
MTAIGRPHPDLRSHGSADMTVGAAEGATRMHATIAPMASEDWPAVRAIFEEGIAAGNATFETEAPEWAVWDGAHLPAPRFVARGVDGVDGWGALSPVSRRGCYAGVAEVSIYVAARARGRGVGRALLGALVVAAEREGLWTLQAVVFPDNPASIKLHEACGFRLVGRRERIARLRGSWRDTLLMERRSPTVGTDRSR